MRTADRATLATGVFVAPELARVSRRTERSRGSGGSLRVVAFEPERFVLETETPLDSLLVSSHKRFAPYWRFSLDGRRAEGFTANGSFPRRRASARAAPGRGEAS